MLAVIVYKATHKLPKGCNPEMSRKTRRYERIHGQSPYTHTDFYWVISNISYISIKLSMCLYILYINLQVTLAKAKTWLSCQYLSCTDIRRCFWHPNSVHIFIWLLCRLLDQVTLINTFCLGNWRLQTIKTFGILMYFIWKLNVIM